LDAEGCATRRYVALMRYGSVCSGIEAATQAWHGMGWEPAFFSEIDAFPSAVLQHHYPEVPLHGDFTTIKDDEYGAIDLLVGGTPCQSFSIAGLRGGMDDDRGNLALEFLRLAQRKASQWLVWENVPGVLSSSGGRDFGSFLGALAEIGYGFAYRVLDAQYFGVAQRRRRVFVVGYLGDWRRAAAVLFERHSLLGNPAPSREEGQEAAATLTRGFGDSGTGGDQIANGNAVVSVACNEVAPAVEVGSGSDPELMATLCAKDNEKWGCNQWVNEGKAIISGLSVRRLTPTECERLQGFPDNFTQIPYRNKPAENCPDGPRYKALGNSMAVPVMRWIGERIQQVEAIR
jgi:DNA (cytosine-5)-methyltransferase 1